MHRSHALGKADELITGQRLKDYGPPILNFTRIGHLWAPILGLNVVQPHEVALCLAQLKVARLCQSPDHEDSWLDALGYIAIGAELATGPDEVPF